MKENIAESIDVISRFRNCLEYMSEASSSRLLDNSLSDEVAVVLEESIEIFDKIIVATDQAIEVLGNRLSIFGTEGIEKKILYEEGDE